MWTSLNIAFVNYRLVGTWFIVEIVIVREDLSAGGDMVYCGNRHCTRESKVLGEEVIIKENWYCSEDCQMESTRITKQKSLDKF